MSLCQRTAGRASAKFKTILYTQNAYCCRLAQQANSESIPWAKSEPALLISESKHRRQAICFGLGIADGKTSVLHLDVYLAYFSFYLWKVMESEKPAVCQACFKFCMNFIWVLKYGFQHVPFSVYLALIYSVRSSVCLFCWIVHLKLV